jgi:hypothetical protein
MNDPAATGERDDILRNPEEEEVVAKKRETGSG